MRTRLTTLLATLAVAGAALAASAPQASATATACRSDRATYLACFNMSGVSGQLGWKINFHLDIYAPTSYVAGLADCGRRNPLLFKAQLWGDDGGGSADDYLGIQTVPIPGWPQHGENYLMALYTFERAAFDEDPGTDKDEIYAKFVTVDCHTGLTRTHRSDNLVGDFR
jgi:hypothetical protein